jgi:hypothetical protein
MSYVILKEGGELEQFFPTTPYEMNVAKTKGIVIPKSEATSWYYKDRWQQRPKYTNTKVSKCKGHFK